MKKQLKALLCFLMISSMILISCAQPGSSGGEDNSQITTTYKVTYDGNTNTEGSAPEDNNSYVTGNTVTVLGNSGSLAKSGFSFAGWNTQSDGNGTTYTQGQTFPMGSSNVTLFAKWTTNQTFTVTYNSNNSTSGSVPEDNTNYETGNTVTVLGNSGSLAKSGSSFAGWNTQSDGNGTTYTQGQTFPMGSSNVTLFAKWTTNQTFTVTYNSNNSTSGSVPEDNTNYETGNTVTVLGNSGNLAKSGSSFAGWNTQSDGNGTTYTQGQTFPIGSSNVTLFAKWELLPSLSITYMGNSNTSGSVPQDNNLYKQGDNIVIKGNDNNLQRKGYCFGGWNTQQDGNGDNYSEGQTIEIGTDNIILHAKWMVTPFTDKINTGAIAHLFGPSFNFKMTHLEGGITYLIGKQDDGDFNNDGDCSDAHDNNLGTKVDNAFFIAETEVTYQLWKTVYDWAIDSSMDHDGNGSTGDDVYNFDNPGRQGGNTTIDSLSPVGSNQHPVTTIYWYDALVWCNALTEYYNSVSDLSFTPVYTYGASKTILRDSSNTTQCNNVTFSRTATGFRLSTIAEWNLAARFIKDNGNKFLENSEYYPGLFASGADAEYNVTTGSDYDNDGDFETTSGVAHYNSSSTTVVKSKSPNALNLYDMSGNVYEWCFDSEYGTDSGDSRSFLSNPFITSASSQYIGTAGFQRPWYRASYLGFRIAKTY